MSKVRSMTGFASATASLGGSQITVDLKSVNHRFLDLSIRLPVGFESQESRIQQRVRDKIGRGRIEISVTRIADTSSSAGVVFQRELFAAAFSTLATELKSAISDDNERSKIITRHLLSRQEVLSFGNGAAAPDPALIESSLDVALTQALNSLIAMRETEATSLVGHLKAHLKVISAFVEKVRPLTTEGVERFRERVAERMKAVDVGLTPERLATEVALLADRTDITEELERLSSHLTQFHGLMEQGGEIGKKLDFLVQECGREINTVGSKSQSSRIGSIVVDAKAALEKLREQIQNIE